MAGFGAFLTHVFFSLPQEEEKNLKKNFSTSIIFDFISNYTNYIHIYLLHAHYSSQDFFAADLSTG